MKRTIYLFCMAMICCTSFAQQKVYTLADWNIKDWDSQKGELELDVSEYKLNFNHPLPFQDMQSSSLPFLHGWLRLLLFRCSRKGLQTKG